MNTKIPECYTIDSQAECLRIEITAESSLLLPHDQFMFAELTSEAKEQKLRLVFAMHEVSIFGHVLRRIEAAMQRMELSGLMKIPEKYHALIPDNQPKIRDLVVTEIKPADQSAAALN